MGVSFEIPGRAGARSADGVRSTDRSSAVVSLAVAIITSAVLVVSGAATDMWLGAALTIGAMAPAAVVDVRERRLPDDLLLGAAVVFLVACGVTLAISGSVDVRSMLIGCVVFTGPILALHLVSPAAMGFGDVKAGIVLGAALGAQDWRLALTALTLGSAFGAAVGLVRRQRTVAFGAYLVGGSAASLLLGSLIGSYIGQVQP